MAADPNTYKIKIYVAIEATLREGQRRVQSTRWRSDEMSGGKDDPAVHHSQSSLYHTMGLFKGTRHPLRSLKKTLLVYQVSAELKPDTTRSRGVFHPVRERERGRESKRWGGLCDTCMGAGGEYWRTETLLFLPRAGLRQWVCSPSEPIH